MNSTSFQRSDARNENLSGNSLAFSRGKEKGNLPAPELPQKNRQISPFPAAKPHGLSGIFPGKRLQ